MGGLTANPQRGSAHCVDLGACGSQLVPWWCLHFHSRLLLPMAAGGLPKSLPEHTQRDPLLLAGERQLPISSREPQGHLKLGTCRLLSHLTMILMVSASCAAYSENLGTLESGQQIGTLEIIFSTQAENLLQKPLGREFQASGFQSESSWSQVSCLK